MVNTTGGSLLRLRGVEVFVDEKQIVKGVDLEVNAGEVHAIMGPNGSGKSTLASAIMGHPGLQVRGEILLDGEPIGDLEPDERARRGLFLGFQYPVAVPGVTSASFLRAAVSARTGENVGVREFKTRLQGEFEALGIPWEFAGRYLNDGFSGGEKKRFEILQMLMLQPRVVLLDEIDSGLDIDALKTVAEGIRRAADRDTSVVIVTHYQRILDHVRPDRVHVFVDGRVARSGGPEQALELERRGYEWLQHSAPGAGVSP